MSREIVRTLLDGSITDELVVDLTEPGESVKILVAYVGRGREKLRLHYRVNHIAPETKSEILVCGVLAEQAEKELLMEIDFRRGCAGAVGEEREDMVTLSDQAVNKARPVIYCEEENVRGTHGASTGRLDERALNYLRMRGLSEPAARRLLLRAKLMQIVGKVSDAKKAQELAKKLEKVADDLVK